MAYDPFAFLRGSAALFYRDLAEEPDRWAKGDAARVWIHGDLHCQNFRTYLDDRGRLLFDVNDFDEAYVGPFTWDLRRFTTSLALLAWQKALPDETTDDLLTGYLDQVAAYRDGTEQEFSLRMDNTPRCTAPRTPTATPGSSTCRSRRRSARRSASGGRTSSASSCTGPGATPIAAGATTRSSSTPSGTDASAASTPPDVACRP